MVRLPRPDNNNAYKAMDVLNFAGQKFIVYAMVKNDKLLTDHHGDVYIQNTF